MWMDIDCGERVDLGEGLRLTRVLAPSDCDVPPFDPLLLIDDIDMNGHGFPSHLHSGFEKLTLTVDGRVRHTDESGHDDILNPGDVHYLFAGAGFVHAELPVLRCRVIQIWFNIPDVVRSDRGFAKIYRRQACTAHETDWGSFVQLAGDSSSISLACAASVSVYRIKPCAEAKPILQGVGLAYLLHGGLSTPKGYAQAGQCLAVRAMHRPFVHFKARDEGCTLLWIVGNPLQERVSMLGGHVVKAT
ncbi:redox-sensitive bicupin YhaK (pirin superfamily) [Alicyclobacillus sacchari]|uniref:Redox-sensitive bicupin YhaK (Pirin superfamily) n=1 Tax=Alicyclobacillus sacchari TaxID=392010 RepID=A0A4R8LQB0_9BACL|nr:redox-sensitive bicupin YhaK (pirin superfamily) [Alicyclobacillus sacchari]